MSSEFLKANSSISPNQVLNSSLHCRLGTGEKLEEPGAVMILLFIFVCSPRELRLALLGFF